MFVFDCSFGHCVDGVTKELFEVLKDTSVPVTLFSYNLPTDRVRELLKA